MQSRPAGFVNIICGTAFSGEVVVPQHLVGGYAVLLHEVLNQLPQSGLACLLKLAAGILIADLNMQRTVIVSGSCIRDLIVRNDADDLAVQTDYVLRTRLTVRFIREHSSRNISVIDRQSVCSCSCLPGVMHADPLRSACKSYPVIPVLGYDFVYDLQLLPSCS